MKIALFDFDGTVTWHDTFMNFSRFAVGNAKFFAALTLTFPTLLRRKLGKITNSGAKEILFGKLFKGMQLNEFRRLGGLYADKIDENLRWNTMFLIKNHLQHGHRVVIVSSSVGDWIRPWAYENGIDEIIATEVEIDKNGRLTGHFVTANCFGDEKARRILEAIPDLENHEVWAYGTTRGDDAMLALAQHANRI